MAKNYVSNKDETVRMFKSDFMEMFSRVHWTVPLYIFLPVVFYMLYSAVFRLSFSAGTVFIYFLLGLAVWTLTEYSLHRFIFHFNFKSELGKKIHFIFHGVHHDYPNDSKRLVMPPSVSLPLAVIFYLIFYYILGAEKVYPFFGGFILGYLIYDMTHYAVHHFPIKNRFWLAVKKHHMLHHYKEAGKGFGVSQPLWDHVFATNFDKKTNSDAK